MLGSYPQVYTLGHKAVADLLHDPVLVEEKVDGSQFSFGLTGNMLGVRSKGAEITIDAPEKMFASAVETVRRLVSVLTPDWIYRAEVLCKPKHNVLAYDRVPRGNLILFDVQTSMETYLGPKAKLEEAGRLGLEVVPTIYHGMVESIDQFRAMLTIRSVLGGQTIEGVVIKNYSRFGIDKKVLMGKFVSEHFKEVHEKEWKASNPTGGDIIQAIIGTYHSPARWQKALLHCRERGIVEDSPRDIGTLMKEVWPDILREEQEDIKDRLFTWAEDKIRRGVLAGLPEWYKELLLTKQFEETHGN